MGNKQEDIYGNIKVIRNKKNQWGVEDLAGNIIVPYGKYCWISGFDLGLARVKNGKWGIINEHGEEVLPVEFDAIWKFEGKNRDTTRVEKDGESCQIYLSSLNPDLPGAENNNDCYHRNYHTGYERLHYEQYNGTYAQDIEGLSDEFIGDVLDGEPDAYWNID